MKRVDVVLQPLERSAKGNSNGVLPGQCILSGWSHSGGRGSPPQANFLGIWGHSEAGPHLSEGHSEGVPWEDSPNPGGCTVPGGNGNPGANLIFTLV